MSEHARRKRADAEGESRRCRAWGVLLCAALGGHNTYTVSGKLSLSQPAAERGCRTRVGAPRREKPGVSSGRVRLCVFSCQDGPRLGAGAPRGAQDVERGGGQGVVRGLNPLAAGLRIWECSAGPER